MEYIAADYLVDALGIMPNYCISYENVRPIIDQAPEDVARYLKEEGDEDFLFIFKKFPDVFILTESIVTLTDEFLSLYAFPNSSTFSIDNTCAGIFEVDAIEFFKLILIRCGTCHYIMLFDALLSNKNSHLSYYFSHYTTKDKYSFFQSYSNTFSVLNDNVHLKETLFLITPYPTLQGKYTTYLRRLSKATYFLLACFELLHYIQLKQCISFVLNNVKIFLNQHSLIKQREIFQCMEGASMNELGYLTYSGGAKVKSQINREKLLIVCILAFNREMHFSKVVEEVKNRWVGSVKQRCIYNLSAGEQQKYFYKMSKLFVIHNNGYVNLQPSFSFPLCYFDDYSLEISQRLKTVNVSNFGTGGQKTKPWNKLPLYDEITSQNFDTGVCSKMQESQSGHNTDLDVKVPKGIEKQGQEIPLILCDKLHSSVLFLQNCFHPLVPKHILEVFLHALNPAKTYFSDLELNNQHIFITKCFQFIECVTEIYPLSSQLNTQCLIKDEECLLFITYLLIKMKSLHYRTIVKEMNKFQLTPPLLSTADINKQDSDWFKYFRNFNEYFMINGTGYVCLSSTFSSLSSVIGSVPASTEEMQKTTNFYFNTQSEVSVMCNKLNKETDINTCQNIIKNIGNPKEKVEDSTLLKEEIVTDYACTEDSYSASDVIIDICFSILTVSEKMQIEKLCNHLNSFNISSIQNYFSFHTVAEKLNFFSSLSQYFDVSRDGFVSLRKDVETYVPKTKYIKQDCNGRFVSCNTITSRFRNHSEAIATNDSPNLSDSSSSSTSSVKLKKVRVRRFCKKKIIMLRQVKVDPLAIHRVNNILCANSNENINNLCNESKNNLSENNNFNTLTSHNRNINEENRKSSSENSNNLDQICLQKYLAESDEHNEILVKSSVLSNKSSIKREIPEQFSIENSFEKRENNTLCKKYSKNGFDFTDLEYESFICHGTELLSLFLDQLGTDIDISNIKKCDNTTSNLKATHKEIFSNDKEEMSDKNINCKNYASSNINNHLIVDVSKHLNRSSYLLDEIVECRAVNFFCVILANNDKGLSTDFLIKHLNLASLEVQEFMSSHYKENVLSFFEKHEKDFYISPQTNFVHLVKVS